MFSLFQLRSISMRLGIFPCYSFPTFRLKCPSSSSSSTVNSSFPPTATLLLPRPCPRPRPESATCLLLWWCVGTRDAVNRPRVGLEQDSGWAAAVQVALLLDLEAVASQQLSGHHHEGFLHVLTHLDADKRNFRQQFWPVSPLCFTSKLLTFADVSKAASMPPFFAMLQASSNWTWRSFSRSHLLPMWDRKKVQEM